MKRAMPEGRTPDCATTFLGSDRGNEALGLRMEEPTSEVYRVSVAQGVKADQAFLPYGGRLGRLSVIITPSGPGRRPGEH